MALPTPICEVAFTTNPFSTPVWVDVTAQMRGFSITRGRNHELGRVTAGKATVELNNRDRRFDPTHTAGPYWPHVRPLRRIRLRATFNAVTYDLFEGFVEEWPQQWREHRDAYVPVTASDMFSLWAARKFSASPWPAERSDLRIGRLLDLIGWPAGERTLDTGQTTVKASTPTDELVLAHMQSVTEAENGLVFIGGDGNVEFHSRHHRILNNSTSVATFGDAEGELPIHDLELSYDLDELYNDVRVTRDGGTTQTAADVTSQATYGVRTLERSGQWMTTDNEAYDAAHWLLAQHKDPAVRVDSMTLKGQKSDLLWPHILGRELSDRVTVNRRPPGGGSAISQQCHIEQVKHVAKPGQWTCRWQLSPAEIQSYWVLGDATLSVLGSTTRLGY